MPGARLRHLVITKYWWLIKTGNLLRCIKKVNPDSYLDEMADEDLKKIMVVYQGEQLIGTLKPS
jgi:hypothetical protein